MRDSRTHPYRLFMLEYNSKRLGISNGVAIHYTDQNFPLWRKFTRVVVDSRARRRGIIDVICRDACSICVVPLARRGWPAELAKAVMNTGF